MAYVVTVEWSVKSDHADQFQTLAAAQAENSVALEEECLQFDLCRDMSDRSIFFMYEIYSDKKAFDDHLASQHFKDFSAAVESLVNSKTVRTLQKI